MSVFVRAFLTGLVLLAVACGDSTTNNGHGLEGETPLSEEAAALLGTMHGRWQLQHLVVGFCPQSIGRSPFMGESRWQEDNGRLVMSPVHQNVAQLTLTPQTGETLTQSDILNIEGCQVHQDITVTFKARNGRYAQGVYAAHYYHDGSAACAALVETHGIQDSCSVTADWSGVKLSSAP